MILVKKHIHAHFDTKSKGRSTRKIQKLSKRKVDGMRRKGRWIDVMCPNLHWVQEAPPNAVNILKGIPSFISSLNIGKRQRYSRTCKTAAFQATFPLTVILLACFSSLFLYYVCQAPSLTLKAQNLTLHSPC